jgi:hypothetical protein
MVWKKKPPTPRSIQLERRIEQKGLDLKRRRGGGRHPWSSTELGLTPNNSTSTLSSSLGGAAADLFDGVMAVSDKSVTVAVIEATKRGAPGEPSDNKED